MDKKVATNQDLITAKVIGKAKSNTWLKTLAFSIIFILYIRMQPGTPLVPDKRKRLAELA